MAEIKYDKQGIDDSQKLIFESYEYLEKATEKIMAIEIPDDFEILSKGNEINFISEIENDLNSTRTELNEYKEEYENIEQKNIKEIEKLNDGSSAGETIALTVNTLDDAAYMNVEKKKTSTKKKKSSSSSKKKKTSTSKKSSSKKTSGTKKTKSKSSSKKSTKSKKVSKSKSVKSSKKAKTYTRPKSKKTKSKPKSKKVVTKPKSKKTTSKSKSKRSSSKPKVKKPVGKSKSKKTYTKTKGKSKKSSKKSVKNKPKKSTGKKYKVSKKYKSKASAFEKAEQKIKKLVKSLGKNTKAHLTGKKVKNVVKSVYKKVTTKKQRKVISKIKSGIKSTAKKVKNGIAKRINKKLQKEVTAFKKTKSYITQKKYKNTLANIKSETTKWKKATKQALKMEYKRNKNKKIYFSNPFRVVRNTVAIKKVNELDSTFKRNKKRGQTYGVDQNSTLSRWKTEKERQKYIKKFSKKYKMSKKDVSYVMDYIDNIGACSYADASNVIINKYKNNPKEFKKKFGFSLYKKNSNGKKVINQQELLFDMYLTSNTGKKGTTKKLFEKNSNGKITISKNFLTVKKGKTRSGRVYNYIEKNDWYQEENQAYMSDESQLKKYLKKHRLKSSEDTAFLGKSIIDLKNKKAVQDYIANNIAQGKTVSLSRVSSKKKPARYINTNNGKSYTIDGAHITTVTGFDNKGIYVDSWGEKYMIEYKNLRYSNDKDVFISRDIYAK